jgi:hypothetical protein
MTKSSGVDAAYESQLMQPAACYSQKVFLFSRILKAAITNL